ncbi:MAG: hypothetical protein KGZ73_15000 [Rhizobiales bacterium]|nr:hypothetical protein [Hyphomicrobiales bacterium]
MHARLFARLALAVGLVAAAIVIRPGSAEKAEAQGVSVSIEFREALAPHGRWHRHSRWGEVWIPARVERGWRPYTRGHWVYTDDWGWYWVSDEDWGWVAYHYGRWVFDAQVGWVWVPGREWGPAWVSWRRGGAEVGWAPLPPDDYVDRIDDDPNVWIFVDARNLIAPSIVRVQLPYQRSAVLVRQTVIVNRTVYVSGARVAANAGVPPSYIAARVGRPIRVSQVRPVVVRGTVGVSNAVEIDVKAGAQQKRRAEVKQAARSIEPAKDVPEPKRFERGSGEQENPDTPKVLREAQPGQQKKEDTQKEKRDDGDAQKAKQKSDDDALNAKQKQKRDDGDAQKAKQKSDDDALNAKQKQKRDDGDAQKAEQKSDDDALNAKQKQDAAPKAPEPQQKRDEQKQDAAPKASQPQQKRDEQKQDAAPKAPQPQQKLDEQKQDAAPKATQPQQKRDDQSKQLPQKQDAAPKAPPQQQQQTAPQPKAPAQKRDPSPEQKKEN